MPTSEAVDLSTNVVRFPRQAPPVLSPATPMPSAHEMVERDHTVCDDGAIVPTLHYTRGDFLTWRGTHYERVDTDAMRAMVWRFLNGARRRVKETVKDADGQEAVKVVLQPFNPTPSSVSAVVDALQAVAELNANKLPAWSNAEGKPPAAEILPCANGLLHLPTRKLLPHSPEFVGVNVVPYAYDPEAPKPVEWLRFLDSLWDDDPESIDCLQEWMGYCTTQRTEQHKIMLFLGATRGGKGTIVKVLREMIGTANVCGPTIASMQRDFGLQPLLDKQLAVFTDAKLSGRADQAVIAERLLLISGGDPISIPRKYLDDVQVQLPTKLMLVSNEEPRLSDDSGALAGRFLALTFTRSFLGKEDTGLLNRLLKELPGILLWALEGLARLDARGRFMQPVSGAGTIDQIRDLGSPVLAFVRDCCEVGSDKIALRSALYAAWKRWCSQTGHHETSRETFGKGLRAAVPKLRDGQSHDGQRRYAGIALKPLDEFGAIGGADNYDFG